jgi:hypothetical protein
MVTVSECRYRWLRAPATTLFFDIARRFTPIYARLRAEIAGSNPPAPGLDHGGLTPRRAGRGLEGAGDLFIKELAGFDGRRSSSTGTRRASSRKGRATRPGAYAMPNGTLRRAAIGRFDGLPRSSFYARINQYQCDRARRRRLVRASPSLKLRANISSITRGERGVPLGLASNAQMR